MPEGALRRSVLVLRRTPPQPSVAVRGRVPLACPGSRPLHICQAKPSVSSCKGPWLRDLLGHCPTCTTTDVKGLVAYAVVML